MESSKKILLSTIVIAIVIVLLTGITFAFFNYTRTGASNTVRVGRISFVTNQTDTISLTNLFPIDSTETGIMNDDTKVGTLEITIEGDTDYSEGIEYLVSSVESSIYTNQGQIVPISLDVTVDDLGTSSTNYFTARENTNESIYKKLVGDTLVGDQMLLVGYIVPNTTPGTANGIDGSITIKAYLDKNKILISDTYDGTESDNMGTTNAMASGKTVITTSEWNALQSTGVSFKVRVEANEGIWVEEEPTPNSCFTFETMNNVNDEPLVLYNSERTNANITSCVNHIEEFWGPESENNYLDDGESYQSFCAGTGTVDGNDILYYISNNSFDSEDIDLLVGDNILKKEQTISITGYDASCGSDVIIPEKITMTVPTSYSYNTNRNADNINDCVDLLNEYVGPESEYADEGKTYQDFCAGTGTLSSSTIQEVLENEWFDEELLYNLEEIHIISMQTIQVDKYITTITGHFDEFYGAKGAFSNKGLTSVRLPNYLENIGNYAFYGNNLTTITIPDSVTYIGNSSFTENDITSLDIGNGIDRSTNNLTNYSVGIHINAFDWDEIRYIDMENISGATSGMFDLSSNYNNGSKYLVGEITLGNKVKIIGHEAFKGNKITNVIFSNNVEEIGPEAFDGNSIEHLILNNGIKEIGINAFSGNSLISVEIPSSIETIRDNAFYKTSTSNNNLSSITINKTCSAIKSMSNYPWLGTNNRAGTTIYGLNNEVCDAY